MGGRQPFAPGVISYDRSMSDRYRIGRALSPEAASVWRTAIEPYIPRVSSFRIADVGAGTCRFLPVLAAFPGARVICIDPSFDMLAAGAHDGPGLNALYGVANGERLPLRPASCDVVWLSQSYHHVADRAGLALELRQVIKEGGRVLIRNSFSDRLHGFPTLFHFFPGARQLSMDLPTVQETVRNFEGRGFVLESDRQIPQQTCGSLREFEARTRLRADSSLALLSDQEFQSGLDDLSRAVERETEPSPVIEILNLLVFRSR